ncbi:unnamed protein product [Ceutorhynchus assimilis]|uniref:Uncharacterized protein n=1 Tax=Ceutorhynchus assimilis TaxID=467358 RepID=A0A9N9QJ34_9CUCU|nr:unnamed protein product [Ceutorhynchus assimilis]
MHYGSFKGADSPTLGTRIELQQKLTEWKIENKVSTWSISLPTHIPMYKLPYRHNVKFENIPYLPPILYLL